MQGPHERKQWWKSRVVRRMYHNYILTGVEVPEFSRGAPEVLVAAVDKHGFPHHDGGVGPPPRWSRGSSAPTPSSTPPSPTLLHPSTPTATFQPPLPPHFSLENKEKNISLTLLVITVYTVFPPIHTNQVLGSVFQSYI